MHGYTITHVHFTLLFDDALHSCVRTSANNVWKRSVLMRCSKDPDFHFTSTQFVLDLKIQKLQFFSHFKRLSSHVSSHCQPCLPSRTQHPRAKRLCSNTMPALVRKVTENRAPALIPSIVCVNDCLCPGNARVQC
jgi:hypothetical protein